MSTVESLKDAGRVTWKWIKRLILLTILVFISYFLFLIFANYSEGTRTGFVTKISKRGYVFKTFEGELNYGFFSGTANTGKPADNVWYFSVTNSRVAYDVEKASESGRKVTLFYHQKYKALFFRGDTEYLVYQVENAEFAPDTPK